MTSVELKDKRYWIFDMDGTLTEAMHDFDAMRAELSLPVGVPILEALAALEPEAALQKHRELDAMELRMASDATPQPGCMELLDCLIDKGAKVGILTRNGKAIAEATLRACGIDHYFSDETVISRDCCEPKPHPAGVHQLLELWNARAEETVMVGDYLFDLEAGRRAGVASVHMDVTAQYAWPEMTDVGVASLAELQSRLN